MRAELLAAAGIVAAAVIGVRHFETPPPSVEAPPAANALSARAAPERSPYSAGWGQEVRIAAARDSQYYVTASVNALSASFLVDTGASYVALRDSDARLAGVHASWADFNRPIRTANGETKAALVMLDALEIDGIRIENVPAFILPDEQLSINLLGMSFLSRLESVEVRGGELVLRG